MPTPFCTGYGLAPFRALVEEAPGSAVYPKADFRLEWGPVFHRGRLDGSARVLVIGQDPAQHEAMARRILVGEAGQRVQGFLARLGIRTSYVMINAFLYSVYGGSGSSYEARASIIAYRNRWLDALVPGSNIEAVVAFGGRADDAWDRWRATTTGAAFAGAYAHVTHPTYPERDAATRNAKTKAMLVSWNTAITTLRPAILHPDFAPPTALYVEKSAPFPASGRADIPRDDLPAGSPAWMAGKDDWASRGNSAGGDKRYTITVRVPSGAR